MTETRIPLTIPMYKYPNAMSRSELIALLGDEHRSEPKSLLAARVLQNMVNTTLVIDPNMMDDRQPEKWIHVANLMLQEAEKLEPNPLARIEVMKRVNAYLEKTENMSELIKIASGENQFPTESALYRTLMRLGAALMIEPIIEYETQRSNPDVSIAASITIFQMVTGFMGIPKTLAV